MTHINAYYADVDEAKRNVEIAEGLLHEAEERLRLKQVEEGHIVEGPTKDDVEVEEQPEGLKGPFGKKK